MKKVLDAGVDMVKMVVGKQPEDITMTTTRDEDDHLLLGACALLDEGFDDQDEPEQRQAPVRYDEVDVR